MKVSSAIFVVILLTLAASLTHAHTTPPGPSDGDNVFESNKKLPDGEDKVSKKNNFLLLERMFKLLVKGFFGSKQSESCMNRMQCEIGLLVKGLPTGHLMLQYLVMNYLPTHFHYLGKVIESAVDTNIPCETIPCDHFLKRDEL